MTPKELEDEVEAAGAEVTEAPKEKAGELELRLELGWGWGWGWGLGKP